MSRRSVLKVLGAGAVGMSAGVGAPRPLAAAFGLAGGAPVKLAALPFALADVKLLESAFTQAQARNVEYMLSLSADRMLAYFRKNAGLQPKAPVYGGWESQDPWNDIRCHGHTLGHWLTAAALHYDATKDARCRERVDYIILELKACQDARGDGLICAFPDGAAPLEAAVKGQRIPGVPWYTMHKVFAGLRDAHLLTGNEDARQVLTRLAEWTWNATSSMTEEQMQQMLRVEHGGMTEVLGDTYVITKDERFLTLAKRFAHRALLDPLVAGRDSLDGLHANTQIPKVIGFQRLYELTGEPQYLAASKFFWNIVVRDRSFATGGHGENEHFFPPAQFPQRLMSAKTMETCGSHNMLRLTRMLFAAEPSAAYADHYERALYNTILAAQDPDSGWNTYFQSTRPGYLKLYHTPTDSFWCCTGTGIENHAKYGDSIYFRGDDALYVNLFIPSELVWKEKALTLRQATSFPSEEGTRLTITAARPVRTTLHVRKPWWSEAVTVAVNGHPAEATLQKNGYIALRREWRTGDVVEVRTPMSVYVEPLINEPRRVAFLYGPLVLAGRLGKAGLFPGADILRNERTVGQILDEPIEIPTLRGTTQTIAAAVKPVAGSPLTFRTEGVGRPQDVTLVPFHQLHHERYNLYWELMGS